MNAAHDLGGACGFGAIDRSRSAQFAEPWEASVFGMTLACGMLGQWNLDQSRFAREKMEPAHYLAGSYYEHWLHGLECLLLERGMVSEAELRSGKAVKKSADATGDMSGTSLQAITAAQVPAILGKGAPTGLPAEAKALFAVGDRVRVRRRETAPQTHTRAPRYTQGREGVVAQYHGAHVFPDRHAAGEKQPAHLYGVRFAAEALWGDQASAPLAVYVDLFEPYLEAADGGDDRDGGDDGDGRP